MIDTLEVSADFEHKNADKLRERVGTELICQRDLLEGPRNKLDNARSKAAYLSGLANRAAVVLTEADRTYSAAEADAVACMGAADAAHCTGTAIARLCELAKMSSLHLFQAVLQ